MPKLKQTDKYTYEAALDLGASPIYAFFKVVFPDIMPGAQNCIDLAKGSAVIRQNNCLHCGNCLEKCPVGAIVKSTAPRSAPRTALFLVFLCL